MGPDHRRPAAVVTDLTAPVDPPRLNRFFWAFPGEVPPDASPEALAALGARLTGGS